MNLYICAGPYAVLSKVQSQDNPLVRVQFAALPRPREMELPFFFKQCHLISFDCTFKLHPLHQNAL